MMLDPNILAAYEDEFGIVVNTQGMTQDGIAFVKINVYTSASEDYAWAQQQLALFNEQHPA